MGQFIEELKNIIKGKVLNDLEILEHYSKDESIFQMKPWAIIQPASKEDISALVKWVSGKRKQFPGDNRFSITCRGKGTDQTGGPINEGIILRFPESLEKILEIGPDFIWVESGAFWSAINNELEKTGHFVPCYPASANFSTIGGGVANNCGGEKTVKYGSARDYVLALKMILADGKEIEIANLSEEEIAKKQTQDDLEGEIYRRMSDLLVGSHNLIQNSKFDVNKNATGYSLSDVLSDGQIDLTKLISGSQGTLGIITEIKLKTVPKPKLNGLILASFNDLTKAGEAVPKILSLKPSALELVDKFLIEMVQKEKLEMVQALMEGKESVPDIVLIIEFDGDNLEVIKNSVGEAKNILAPFTNNLREAYDKADQDKLWAVRRSAAIVAESAKGAKKALPFIEDSAVNPKYLAEYLKKLYEIMAKYEVGFSVWGHAGNGNLHIQPFLDLGDKKDREKLYSIAEEVYNEVTRLKGALSGEHNDGLMRSPYLRATIGEQMYEVWHEVKDIFDPFNIFNPNKKIDVELEFTKKQLRSEYGSQH